LNQFHPLVFIKVFPTGTNKPVLCIAADSYGNKKDIVIKLSSGERMDNLAFLKEFLASRLAKELGLKTPEPIVAIIEQSFINTQVGKSHFRSLNESLGTNYATEYIRGLEQVSKIDKLNKYQIDDALRIFVFDLIIQNTDRTTVHGKPNLFTTGIDLWVLDHELAFSFLVPIIGRPMTEPWKIHARDMFMIQNHVIYGKIHKKKLDFSILDEFLTSIDEGFWSKIEAELPSKWKSPYFEKIKTHINAIKDNWLEFLNQVKTLLS